MRKKGTLNLKKFVKTSSMLAYYLGKQDIFLPCIIDFISAFEPIVKADLLLDIFAKIV